MQQINLYQDRFKPKKVFLPAWQIVSFALALILCCVIASYYLNLKQQQRQASFAKQQQQTQSSENNLTALRQQLVKRKPDQQLEKKQAELQQYLQNNQQILNYLQQEPVTEQTYFSALIHALTQTSTEQVVINKVQISDAGETISIFGQTNNPQLLTQYIANISSNSALQGKTFSLLKVQQLSKQKFRFVLQTEAVKSS